MLLSNVLLSHRFAQGILQEILFLISTALLVSNLLGYVLFCLLGGGNFYITMIMGEMVICTAAGALSGALMINFIPSLQHK